MSHFEHVPQEHSEVWEDMKQNMGDPEQLKTPIDIEALREACAGNPQLEQFFQSMLDHFYGYTETVWEWQEIQNKKNKGEMSVEEFQEAMDNVDMTRTHSHQAMMDSLTILARAMKKYSLDSTWLAELQDTAGTASRPKTALLALKTTYAHIIKDINKEGKEGVEA